MRTFFLILIYIAIIVVGILAIISVPGCESYQPPIQPMPNLSYGSAAAPVGYIPDISAFDTSSTTEFLNTLDRIRTQPPIDVNVTYHYGY